MVAEQQSLQRKAQNETDGAMVVSDITWDEYMERYAQHHYEWVDGKVIKMSPVVEEHDELTRFLTVLFSAYFSFRPIGKQRAQPFVMRLAHSREPDLQIVLNEHKDRLTPSYVNGPADITIEIVSEESTGRDYGDKFTEYESGGVREYWIIDPIRNETRFNRLTDEKRYGFILPDADGNYTTPLLPDFRLHVPTLWLSPLPDFRQIMAMMQTMVGEQ